MAPGGIGAVIVFAFPLPTALSLITGEGAEAGGAAAFCFALHPPQSGSRHRAKRNSKEAERGGRDMLAELRKRFITYS